MRGALNWKRLKAFALGSLIGVGLIGIGGTVWWGVWYSLSDFGPRDWVLLTFIASFYAAIEGDQ